MGDYLRFVEETRLLDAVDACVTSGDLEYPGTTLEVVGPDGQDLFHVVVDSTGQRQILFFASEENFRLPLDVMERILARAKELVVALPDE